MMQGSTAERLTVGLRAVRVCPMCGYRRIALDPRDFDALAERGIVASGCVRDLRVNLRSVTFGAGWGYDVVDADLLGGCGDGRAVRAASAQGVEFVWRRQWARSSVCRECAR